MVVSSSAGVWGLACVAGVILRASIGHSHNNVNIGPRILAISFSGRIQASDLEPLAAHCLRTRWAFALALISTVAVAARASRIACFRRKCTRCRSKRQTRQMAHRSSPVQSRKWRARLALDCSELLLQSRCTVAWDGCR